MATSIIHDDRIQCTNDNDVKDGRFVLYWMDKSQRSLCNHALEFAAQRANENGVPLLVAFVLPENGPEIGLRQCRFMIEGLDEVSSSLRGRKIAMVVRSGVSTKVIAKLADSACELICDRGYLKEQVQSCQRVSREAACRVWQVESDVIVPVEIASDHREYAARTIRSKLQDTADEYTTDLTTTPLDHDALSLGLEGLDLADRDSVLKKMPVDFDVEPTDEFIGGTSQATSRLQAFVSGALGSYDERTSVVDPSVSYLSPYLRFGQISPVTIALEVKSKRGYSTETKEAFLEELLVRRELAVNFVHYESNYDSLKCLPDWASETLEKHEQDERENHYTASQLENAETHDHAWNAAMMEMKYRGYLHNHLRMYWGKKILEWTNTVNHAYRTAIDLNNRYFLDGRDPNSYTNVAWLFGLHDRAHQEREIFGKVRYMSAGGLQRKIDVDTYLSKIENVYGQRHNDGKSS